MKAGYEMFNLLGVGEYIYFVVQASHMQVYTDNW